MESGIPSVWGHEDEPYDDCVEDEEEGGYGYGGGGYEDDEDEAARLSPQDVEQLVDKYLTTRRRADELESENAKLTQQLIEMGKSNQETLVIHVSPEMW